MARTQVGNRFQVMPPGYVLADNGALFYWLRTVDGEEGIVSCDRWWCRRCAWARYRADRILDKFDKEQ